MNKPIVIKQKCNNINCSFYMKKEYPNINIADCKTCKGTGEQEMEITPLRDFEKCNCGCHRKGTMRLVDCLHHSCIGYIIPKKIRAL